MIFELRKILDFSRPYENFVFESPKRCSKSLKNPTDFWSPRTLCVRATKLKVSMAQKPKVFASYDFGTSKNRVFACYAFEGFQKLRIFKK